MLKNKVREYREGKGEGLRELAIAVGMTPGHLSKLERGLSGCGDEIKMRLAAHFGTSVTAIFFQGDVSTQEMVEAVR